MSGIDRGASGAVRTFYDRNPDKEDVDHSGHGDLQYLLFLK